MLPYIPRRIHFQSTKLFDCTQRGIFILALYIYIPPEQKVSILTAFDLYYIYYFADKLQDYET